jgi:RimJ/RimL family protein N-acetyltransferase
MNLTNTNDKQQLKEILALSIRNQFYTDQIWFLITGKLHPKVETMLKQSITTNNFEIAQYIQQYMMTISNPKIKYEWFVFTDEDDKIIGFVSYSRRIDLENGKCFLEYMLIDKNYRGKGYSNIMLEKFFDWCRENNISKIKIQFEANIPQLVHLYSKYGFRKIILEIADTEYNGNYENWYKFLN